DRVYEMGKAFRNEGVDSTHSPEYTQLEAYAAYGDYDTMADLTRTLIQDAARTVGMTTPLAEDGTPIDLLGEWRSVSIHDALSAALGAPITLDTGADDLRRYADKHDVVLRPGWTAGEIVLELFEKLVEHTIVQPTFVKDYPVEVRP